MNNAIKTKETLDTAYLAYLLRLLFDTEDEEVLPREEFELRFVQGY